MRVTVPRPFHSELLQDLGWMASIVVSVVALLSISYYAGRVTERVDALANDQTRLRSEFADSIKQTNTQLAGIHSEIKDLTAYTSNIAGKLNIPPQKAASLPIVPDNY